jgi:hypothetical protein
MASRSSTSIAKKARSKAEADFTTWLMMATLGSFDDLLLNAQRFLTNYRARLDRMSEAESKVPAIREVYGAYFNEMGGTGAAPEQASRNAIPDGNVVKFQKSRKPQGPRSAAAIPTGQCPENPYEFLSLPCWSL